MDYQKIFGHVIRYLIAANIAKAIDKLNANIKQDTLANLDSNNSKSVENKTKTKILTINL